MPKGNAIITMRLDDMQKVDSLIKPLDIENSNFKLDCRIREINNTKRT